ncbi:uncharacterized protein LOC130451850 [Diorhabda sublineata]|uniref:uncharacterized protein LOC130451850 n=1 Tax=Diorhabda sublineata TaxID=1163346 RepID=UPI0024E0729F|nr:uncharacterized protein LOC130451850 [Diorhabda sublineata]
MCGRLAVRNLTRYAFDMWRTLETKYERKGLPGQLFLKKKLLSLKLEEGDSLEKFIMEFEETLRHLKATGVKTDEQDIVCNLLMALPKSYETVVTIIENMPKELLTYKNVKKKLLAEYEKRKIARNYDVSSPAAAFLSDRVCYGCGKRGHIRSECWSQKRGTVSRGSRSSYRGSNEGRGNMNSRGRFQLGRGNVRNSKNQDRIHELKANRYSNHANVQNENQDMYKSVENDSVCFMTGPEMAGNKCVYFKCGLSKRSDPTIKMYRFPVYDPTRCQKWIIHSGNAVLANLSQKSLRNKLICSKHFSENISQSKRLPTIVPFRYKNEGSESESDREN